MSKEHITFEWSDTGKLEIEVDRNRSATLGFVPSDKVVKETLATFAQSAPKPKKEISNKIIHLIKKTRQNSKMEQSRNQSE